MYILGLRGLVRFSLNLHRFTLLYMCAFFLSNKYLCLCIDSMFLIVITSLTQSTYATYWLPCFVTYVALSIFFVMQHLVPSTSTEYSFHLLYLVNFWGMDEHLVSISIIYNFFLLWFFSYIIVCIFSMFVIPVSVTYILVHVVLLTSELW